MRTIAMICAAGFVAPRDMSENSEAANNLAAAIDKHNYIEIVNNCQNSDFLTIQKHLDRLKTREEQVESDICALNYRHAGDMHFPLTQCADPLSTGPPVSDHETGKEVYVTLSQRFTCTIDLPGKGYPGRHQSKAPRQWIRLDRPEASTSANKS